MVEALRRFRRDRDHEEERLSALLDDEVSEQEALKITRHVADCDRCLRELDAIRRTREALRALPPVEPPSVLYDAVLVKAAAIAPGYRRRWALAATAAVAFALLGTMLAAGDGPAGTITPPVERFVVDHVARIDGGPIVTPADLGR